MELEIFENQLILLLIIGWTLPWKGIALWKAVKLRQKSWFIAILLLNTLAILEILYIFVFSKNKHCKLFKCKQKENKRLENKIKHD
ncbi:hypothetical protein ISS06_00040 [Patescibacteria group bacterium]|nr:hypothetical protein [Patescibacteria group bacterium]